MLKNKNTLYPVLSLMIFSLSLAGCSSKENKETDTVATDTVATEVVEIPEAQDARIDSLGVDVIRIGMDVDSFAPAVEGVYDSIAPEKGYESNLYTFFFQGLPRFTAYEFEPGKVDMIAAESRDIYVVTAQNDTLRLGDNFIDVLNTPGVETIWESMDDEGMWCWKYEGLWFQPDQNRLGESIVDKLYNPSTPPQLSDFQKGETIGYIGTGLPW